MLQVTKHVVDSDTIDSLLKFYRSCTNQITLNGDIRDRHYASSVGHFMITEMHDHEVPELWPQVRSAIQQDTGYDPKLCYIRVLKYNRTCHIPVHVDTYATDVQNPSNVSVIIQASDPESYRGGELIVNKRLMDMQLGDMVLYTYDNPHEVKTVKQGVRYVINIRCYVEELSN